MILDSFVAPDIYPPSAPTLPVAAPGRGTAQLGWNASPESDVVGYRVYRTALTGSSSTTNSSSSAAAATAVNSAPIPTVTYVDDGLQPGAAYRYQVAAVDAMGNESPRSEPTDVTLTMKALAAGTYEDDNTDAILLKGPWGKTASTGAGTDSGGSYTTLNADGYAEMSFATSGIRWLARTNNSSGQADVYIDGVKKATVDLYSSTTKYAQNVYEITGLSETGHTIRIVRTGNKNASSTGRNIILDALVAPDIYAPTAPTAATATAIRTGAKRRAGPRARRPTSPPTGCSAARPDTADVLVGTAPGRHHLVRRRGPGRRDRLHLHRRGPRHQGQRLARLGPGHLHHPGRSPRRQPPLRHLPDRRHQDGHEPHHPRRRPGHREVRRRDPDRSRHLPGSSTTSPRSPTRAGRSGSAGPAPRSSTTATTPPAPTSSSAAPPTWSWPA